MSSFILNNASSFLKSNNARIPLPIIQRSTNNCLKHSCSGISGTNTKGAAPFSHLFLTTASSSSSTTKARRRCHNNPSCRGVSSSNNSNRGRSLSSTSTLAKSSSIMSSNTINNQDHLSGEESQSIPNTPHYININNNNNSTQNVVEIDILSYLSSIENELLQSYPTNHSFQVKIRPQNRRPMIRRLLGIESKDEFYHLCRTVRAILEYEKMYHFVVFVLRDELVHGYDLNYIHEKLPFFQYTFDELTSQYEQQQQQSESLSNQNHIIHQNDNYLIKKGIQPFNRLASGRHYKGKLMDMVQDLTPHLSNQCEDAMTPLTDAQVLLEVIDLVARSLDINTTSTSTNATSTTSLSTSLISPTLIKTTVNERCINAAKECVFHLHDLNNTQEDDDDTLNDDDDQDDNNNKKNDNESNNGNNIQNNYLPKLNGLECEQACITYLEEVLNNNQSSSYKQSSESMSSSTTSTTTSILQNVLVNHKSTQNRSKYSNGNMKNNQGGWKHVVTNSSNSTNANDNEMNPSNSDPTSTPYKTVTGILWTNSGSRENICSEFDALVVHTSITQQDKEEEGDSKKQEVESTTHCRISEFWEAKYSVSPSSLHDAITKKLSAIRSVVNDNDVTISYNGNHYDIMCENTKGVTKFGLFGMELLSPENAIGQLRSTAASYALTNYVDAALVAAETGFVEVKVDYLRRHIDGLKDALSECDDFEIIVRIVK